MAPRPPVALYVHVPFCVSVCPYCDFVVYAGRRARGPGNSVGPFLDALHAELELRADAADEAFGPPAAQRDDPSPGGRARRPLTSVYLGGGTPSLLPAVEVARLLDHVGARFGIAHGAEITLEANPGPDEIGDLDGFRAAGVTRLSVGAQSMDAAELRRLGRRHDAGDVRRAVRSARAAGIGDVNVDLLYDIPGQSVDSWRRTLESVIALDVDHVSAYALFLDDPEREGLTEALGDHLPMSPGVRRWRDVARRAQDDDRAAEMYALADERLASAAYDWYELSNWARPGHASRHNLAYWHHEPYEALGPGAHAFDGFRRRWNAARLDGYLGALLPRDGSAPRLPPGDGEQLAARTLVAERAMLGLRLREGIGEDIAGQPPVARVVAWGRATGLVETADDRRTRLSGRGRLLANELFGRLFAAEGIATASADGREELLHDVTGTRREQRDVTLIGG